MQSDTEILKVDLEQKNFYVMGIKFPFERNNLEYPNSRSKTLKTTDRYDIADVGHTSPTCYTGSAWQRRGRTTLSDRRGICS